MRTQHEPLLVMTALARSLTADTRCVHLRAQDAASAARSQESQDAFPARPRQAGWRRHRCQWSALAGST